jgi:ABC-type branched-subunit amino acid transport system substrate-binding protein
MSRVPLRLLAASVVLFLFAAACGNTTDDESSSDDGPSSDATVSGGGEETRDEFVELSGVPGVTDDEIRYAVVGTKTNNPLGTCILDCYLDGVEAYFAFRNSEGGIYGRDLVIGEVLDDELSQNQAKAQQVVSDDSIFGVFEATLLATGWGVLNDAGVPTYAWGIHATEAADREGVFPHIAVRCSDCPTPAVPYAAKESGKTKAASIGYGATENSKVCTNTAAKAFETFQDDSGVELVYTNDQLEFGLPNGIGPVVTAMKDAGVDFVSTCIDLNGMKTLAQELDRQGMSDVALYHPNTYDQSFVAEAGGLFDGDIVSVQFRPFEADAGDSALTDFQTWMEEEGNEVTELAMVGWINASLAFDGLLAAGPEFDRESVIAATNTFTDYTADGLVVPIDWTKAHIPYTAAEPDPDVTTCTAFVRIDDGQFVTLAPAGTPWFCWPPGDPVEFEPELANFT